MEKEIARYLIESYSKRSKTKQAEYEKFLEDKFNSMNEIVKSVLKTPPSTTRLYRAKNSNTFIFGDIHGELKLFVENLYVAGLIDEKGGWIGKGKKLIQLGDVIDRGKYSWEAFLYLKLLQESTKLKGGKVILLLGNHEQALLVNKKLKGKREFENRSFFKKILKAEINKKNVSLAYGNSKEYILCSHAGIRKNIIKKYLDEKKHIRVSPESTLSSIYKLLDKNPEETIANWLNKTLKEDLNTKKIKWSPFYKSISPRGSIIEFKDLDADKNASPLWTRYYIKRSKIEKSDGKFERRLKKVYIQKYDNAPIKYDKPIQFVGHSITQNKKITRKGNVVFTDTGLHATKSQEFVAISGNNVFRIYKGYGNSTLLSRIKKAWNEEKIFNLSKTKEMKSLEL